MIEKAPLKFHPYLKSVIWGGEKICTYKRIPQPEPKIGESWEISAVPGHETVVEDGVYAGRTLTELVSQFGAELIGDAVKEKYGLMFPLLIKLIDAGDNLSVQVHPDDALARSRHGSLGKTEMWYIIDAAEDSRIYSGLSIAMTPEEYVKRVEEGTFADTLAVHDSHPGDVFFLPAGRVHAIGAGNLLAEIQESSDITYRIYDYDRRDADGNPRELHTHMAKDAIDYNVSDDYRCHPADDSVIDTPLVECGHFAVRRIMVDGPMKLSFDPGSFTVIMCVDGEVTVGYPGGEMAIGQGRTLLCPATLAEITVSGRGTLLATQAL